MASTQSLISIVDDDPSVRRAVRRLVRLAGYATETFASGRDFLDSSAVGRTACLILDIQLGGMTGLELQERLVVTHRAMPIIFIAAYHDALTRDRIARSGAAAYLRKPFDERDLLDAIRAVVDANHGPADRGLRGPPPMMHGS